MGNLLPPHFGGVTVFESELVPFGQALQAGWGDELYVNPYNAYGEREGIYLFKPNPLWTRHCLGVIEGARDRRLRRKRR
jgi:hypothetical protein